MDGAHRASAIAQIVFYAPTVPVTLYVGVRAWKYGPRLAWYPAMAFACGRRDSLPPPMQTVTDVEIQPDSQAAL